MRTLTSISSPAVSWIGAIVVLILLSLSYDAHANPAQCGGAAQPTCLNSLSLPPDKCVADGWTIDDPASSAPLRLAGVGDQGFGVSHLNRFLGVDMFITHVAIQAQRPTAGQTTAILRIWFNDNTSFGDLRPGIVVDTAIVNLPSSISSTDYIVADLDTTINTSGATFWVELYFPTAGGVCMGTREKNSPGQLGESFVVSHESNPATETWEDYELVSPDPGAAYNQRAPVLRPLQLTDCSRNCLIFVGSFDFQTTEDGDSIQMEVGLTEAPLDTVVVDVATTDPTEGIPQITQFTFTPNNWNVIQYFYVVGQDDPAMDGDVFYDIQAFATSSDTCYDGEFSQFTCQNLDNDLIFLETVSVGNPGNADDVATGVGGVAYEYEIGKFEVTNDQYIEFLNAVGQSDNVGLYNPDMGTEDRGGITRSGSFGSYSYSARSNMGNKPVNFVSLLDAMRFCNWLHNGRPSGSPGPGTTETGSYDMSPAPTDTVLRGADATWVVPTEDEFYKAMFHDPVDPGADANGTTDYWFNPTASDDPIVRANANSVGDISNPGPNVVNYDDGCVWNGVLGNVTSVGSAGSSAASHYGTYDQGGNVTEWLDRQFTSGGLMFSWLIGQNCSSNFEPTTDFYSNGTATYDSESPFVGFRVAKLLPPGVCGDADGSGGTDIDDIVFLIAHVFQGGPAPSPASVGDVNCSGGIDIDDIVYLIAFVFQGGNPPCDPDGNGVPDC